MYHSSLLGLLVRRRWWKCGALNFWGFFLHDSILFSRRIAQSIAAHEVDVVAEALTTFFPQKVQFDIASHWPEDHVAQLRK